jgi:hypothetical protein
MDRNEDLGWRFTPQKERKMKKIFGIFTIVMMLLLIGTGPSFGRSLWNTGPLGNIPDDKQDNGYLFRQQQEETERIERQQREMQRYQEEKSGYELMQQRLHQNNDEEQPGRLFPPFRPY